ncbi:MAG: OmpA family protein [Deltaproteobacteria bacterium]|nr:OmpA family protein [Deltaproteobacteria bacterium]
MGNLSSKVLAQDKAVVQIMSLSSEEAARSEADKLMAQGVPSFQRSEDVPGVGVRHHVMVGPFDTRAEARAAAEALKSQKLVKDYIIRSEAAASGSQSSPVLPAAPDVPPGPPATNVPSPPPASSGGDLAGVPVLPPSPPAQGNIPPSADDSWPPPPGSSQAPPANNQEYWPVGPQNPGSVPGSTGQGDWPPPGTGNSDWGTPGASNSSGSSGLVPPPVTQPAQAGPSVSSQANPPVAGSPPVALPVSPPAAPPSALDRDLRNVPVLPDSALTPSPGGTSGEPSDLSGGSDASAPSQGQAGSFRSGQPDAQVAPPPTNQATIIPAKPTGPMKIQGFIILADLSSSMRSLSACPGRLVKQEAVNILLRRMNQRIPSHPYTAALRVFGYKQAWTRKDYTTLYFGPAAYDRAGMESAIGRLYAADSISPFGSALVASEEELRQMNNPRVILMVSDFEETADPGQPADKARSIRREFGSDTKIYTYYVTQSVAGPKLAAAVAKAGGGHDYNICTILEDEAAFETMMTEIFGPRDLPPCRDSDSDGVCDDRDKCPGTPRGAPADERGCWIAAYAQFFDFDKAEVKYAFQPRLKAAAEILINNPQLAQVTIAGHTDNKGTEAYNMDLGLRRAQAVKDLLVKSGAPADKLKVASFGKSRPVDTNDTEEGRAKNRRVEFHVGDVPVDL